MIPKQIQKQKGRSDRSAREQDDQQHWRKQNLAMTEKGVGCNPKTMC